MGLGYGGMRIKGQALGAICAACCVLVRGSAAWADGTGATDPRAACQDLRYTAQELAAWEGSSTAHQQPPLRLLRASQKAVQTAAYLTAQQKRPQQQRSQQRIAACGLLREAVAWARVEDKRARLAREVAALEARLAAERAALARLRALHKALERERSR